MITAEMISAFKVGYDIVNLEGPGYIDTEILVMLNKAQVMVVLDKLKKAQLTHITNLVENEKGNLTAGYDYNHTLIFTPAEEYIGYISSKVLASRATFKIITPAEWLDVELVHKARSGKYITNKLNTPILLVPKVLEEEDKTLVLIYDKFTTPTATDGFILEYIRKPVEITALVDCELNEILHEDVVGIAIKMAKKVFAPQEAALDTQIDANITTQ